MTDTDTDEVAAALGDGPALTEREQSMLDRLLQVDGEVDAWIDGLPDLYDVRRLADAVTIAHPRMTFTYDWSPDYVELYNIEHFCEQHSVYLTVSQDLKYLGDERFDATGLRLAIAMGIYIEDDYIALRDKAYALGIDKPQEATS